MGLRLRFNQNGKIGGGADGVGSVAEEAFIFNGGGTPAVLSERVFYGRPILRVPKQALLGPASVGDAQLREELARLPSGDGAAGSDLLGLALAVLAEARQHESVFVEWLGGVRGEEASPVLRLTERQRTFLSGTSVESLPDELTSLVDRLEHSAQNLTWFAARPVERGEAVWALSVVLRHARPALPLGDSSELGGGWPFRIVPLLAVLRMRIHPDPKVAIAFREGAVIADGQDVESLVQVARSDMVEGDEIFSWPGRLSNSDLGLRLGAGVSQNPIGVGGWRALPENWSPRKSTANYAVYRRYNCTSPEAFELRFSSKGWPARIFVRCYRVSLLLASNTYSPRTFDHIAFLDKWPPPKKYQHEDWLAWTQADRSTNKVILEYCDRMRRRLKESITTTSADEFRRSADPIDRILFKIRSDESKTFKACVALAKTVTPEDA